MALYYRHPPSFVGGRQPDSPETAAPSSGSTGAFSTEFSAEFDGGSGTAVLHHSADSTHDNQSTTVLYAVMRRSGGDATAQNTSLVKAVTLSKGIAWVPVS
jgi:hypothetical protein